MGKVILTPVQDAIFAMSYTNSSKFNASYVLATVKDNLLKATDLISHQWGGVARPIRRRRPAVRPTPISPAQNGRVDRSPEGATPARPDDDVQDT